MKLLRLLALVGVASAVALAAQAPPLQHEHQHPPSAAEKLGKVEFPVSCNAEAQKEFNRGVALLHSFWYEEAVKAFTTVGEKDPGCAMAYWGVAMSHYYPLWYPPNEAHLRAGAEAVEQAKAAGAKTERERDLIAAIETFYKDWQKVNHVTRVLAYEQAMERVYSRYPEDREVAAFYALALQGSATALPPDKTYTRQKKSGAIVERLFAEQPDHPGAAHYTIHAYDYPELCARGLAAARKYAQIAPASPHALHMPSHIFTRLGYWDESIGSNRDSAAAAQAYAARSLPGATYTDDLHAKDYLMYAHLQRGEDRKAKEVLEQTLRVQKVEPENFAAAYALAVIPARYAIERRQWEQARGVALHPQNFPWSRFPWAEGIVYLARGLGAARTGDLAAGRENAEMLKTLDETLSAKPDYWSTQVRIAHWTVAAWLAHAEGKSDEAVKLMRQAADLDDATGKHPVTPGAILPARELLGDLLLELRRPAEALPEFEAALRDSPKRLNALYGAARAAELAGNREKARSYYAQLVALGERGDGERAELRAAKAFLARN